MSIRQILLAGVASVGLASTAIAGGLAEPVTTPDPVPVVPVVPVAPSTDWTGFYVGGSFGNIETSDLAELDGNGFGLHGGYLADLGNWVVGGELEYARYQLDTTDDPEADVLRLKGRVGYDAGQFLPYLALGIAQVDSDDLDIDGEQGVFYGVGADFAATDNILIGFEYLQHDFDDLELEADTISLRGSYKF